MRTTPYRMPRLRIWRGRFSDHGEGDRVPKVVTTLHGTDITLVGSDHSYAETVAFSIEQSDGVTAVPRACARRRFARSASSGTSR